MVLCKFFLQGTCRYGANCRFEHSYNSNYSLVMQQPQSRAQPPSGQINSAKDLSDLVQNDLQLAERGGQWLLSCYCPLPSKAILLPGLEDHSPEELRCMMYQAQSTGNIDPYNQHIHKLYQNAVSARAGFKSPSRESLAIMEKIRTTPMQTTGIQPNPFQSAPAGSSPGSVFGGSVQAQPQIPMFGGSAAQPSVFGGATAPADNPFVGTQPAQPSIFGGSNAPPPNPFIGGGSTQAGIFGGGSAAPANPFAGGTAAQATPFGNPSQPTGAQSSVFGNPFGTPSQGSIFGGGATGSIFGGGSGGGQESLSSFSFATAAQAIQGGAQNQGFMGSPVPQSSPFMTGSVPVQPAGSIFGGSAQPATQPGASTSIFGGTSAGAQQATQPGTSTSIFGGTSAGAQQATQPGTSTSIFGGTSATAQPSSIFGGVSGAAQQAGTANQNPFGTPTMTQPSMSEPAILDFRVYTLMTELTEEEKAEFSAPTFTPGRIPLRPPPKEYCT